MVYENNREDKRKNIIYKIYMSLFNAKFCSLSREKDFTQTEFCTVNEKARMYVWRWQEREICFLYDHK